MRLKFQSELNIKSSYTEALHPCLHYNGHLISNNDTINHRWGNIKIAEGFVFVGAGLLLGIGAIIGAQLGATIIKLFKTNTLKLIFGVYFLYVSMKFITGYFGIMIW